MADTLALAYRKVIRALQHRDLIDDRIAKYASSEPYETFLKPDSEYEHWIPRDEPREKFLVDVAILAGEAIYQARSALDHLFFDLVKLRKGPVAPPSNWKRIVKFPLYTDIDSDVPRPVPVAQFPSRSGQWISPEAYTFIESIQPYHRGDVHRRLFQLVKLSNIDKHRRLSVIGEFVDVEDTVYTNDGGMIRTARLMFKPGAELVPTSEPPEMPSHMKLQRKLSPVVAFDEPEVGPPQTARVWEAIDGICAATGWVVAHLGEFLKQP